MNEKKINYTVNWSEEDQEYVGGSPQYPSLSWLDQNPDLAYAGIRRLIADIEEDMARTGEETPNELRNDHTPNQ